MKLIVPLALVIAIAVVAVSLADGGGTSTAPAPAPDTATAGVIGKVKEAAVKEAPDVAEPVISRSEKAGNITAEQANELRAAAQGLADGKSPRELAPTVDLRDWDVRVVIRDAFDALSRRAPGLAKPIIDDAVNSREITESQAGEIRDRIASGGHRRGCRKGERDRPSVGDQI